MPTRTKTEITIETRRLTVVRGLKIRCRQCGAEVSITAPEIATEAVPTTPREIDQLIDPGALHPTEEAANTRLICANSLADESESDQPQSSDGSQP